MLPNWPRRRDGDIDTDYLAHLTEYRDYLIEKNARHFEEFSDTPRNRPTTPSLRVGGTPAPGAGKATVPPPVGRGSQPSMRPAGLIGGIVVAFVALVAVSGGGDSTAQDDAPGDDPGQLQTAPDTGRLRSDEAAVPPDRTADDDGDTAKTNPKPRDTDSDTDGAVLNQQPAGDSEDPNQQPGGDSPTQNQQPDDDRPGVHLGNLPPGSVVELPGGCTVTVTGDDITLGGPGCGDVEFGMGQLQGLVGEFGGVLEDCLGLFAGGVPVDRGGQGEGDGCGVGGGDLEVGEQVPVGVDGGGDLLVPESGLDGGELNPLGDQP